MVQKRRQTLLVRFLPDQPIRLLCLICHPVSEGKYTPPPNGVKADFRTGFCSSGFCWTAWSASFTISPMTGLTRHRKSYLLPFTVLVVLALLVGIVATSNGANYYMDSTWYLVYARSVRDGSGLSAPITSYQNPQTVTWINQWPPLYPLLLAPGADGLAWGRLTSLALLVVTVGLIYALSIKLLNGQRWLAIVPAVLFLSIPSTTITVFSAIYSEALFIPLALSLLLILLHYRPDSEFISPAWAAGAAVVAALLCLTRYIGAAVCLLGVVYLAAWARTVRHPTRWLPAILLLLALVPLLLYMVYLWQQTGSFTGVQSAGHELSLEDIPDSLRNMAVELLHAFNYPFKLVGLRSNWWGFVVAGLLLALVTVAGWRKRQALRTAFDSRHMLLLLAVVVYMGAFWYLAVRSDPVTARDIRHFVVVYPLILLLTIRALSVIGIPRVAAAGLMTLYALSGITALQTASEGLDYNAPVWHTDPVIAQLPALIPPQTLVHGQDVGYLSYVLGPHTPVRMFGGDSAFENYRCSDLTYPPGYQHAAFTLMYSPLLRTQSPEYVEAFMRDWATPCGEVETITISDFALVMVVRLNQ